MTVVRAAGEKFTWMWSAAKKTSCACTSTGTLQQWSQPARQAIVARTRALRNAGDSPLGVCAGSCYKAPHAYPLPRGPRPCHRLQ